MPTAGVIRHVAFEDLGTFAGGLTRHGFTITEYDAATDDLGAVDGADLLIVLGGPISANDTHVYPFLEAEIALLRDRLAADRATLGICLGAQLMARALGAAVYKARDAEIGWAPLSLSPAGVDLLAPLHATHVLHWHGETFDLPTGAKLLASTDIAVNQAFSFGKRGLGLQFHPEVTAAGLERWFVGHAVEIAATPGVDVPALRAATRQYAPSLATACGRFFDSWLARVMG